MNEIELKAEIARAEKARQLLKDPMLAESIDDMKETVFHNWRTSNFKSMDEREDLYRMIRAIDKFEGDLKRKIEKGKVAQSKLAGLKDKVYDKLSTLRR